MSTDSPNPWRRFLRSYWAFISFLVGFVALLIGICYYYLFPALKVVHGASHSERAQLRAWSALLLSILLITLVCGLMLSFRFGRFFFPRPWRPRSQTKYVDVWAEAGKRVEVPPEGEEKTEDGE